MIRYKLTCPHEHEFEGWFSSSSAFDAQAKAGELSCPICGSVDVQKGLMAPNVAGTKKHAPRAPLDPQRVIQMISALRHHVEANCEDVGDNFAEEARRIHFGESEERGIYGQASLDEARELIEEGIEVLPLPDLAPRKTN